MTGLVCCRALRAPGCSQSTHAARYPAPCGTLRYQPRGLLLPRGLNGGLHRRRSVPTKDGAAETSLGGASGTETSGRGEAGSKATKATQTGTSLATKAAYDVSFSELVEMVESAFGMDREEGVVLDTVSLAGRLCVKLDRGLDPGDTGDLAARAEAFGSNRLPPPRLVSIWDLVVEAFQVRVLP